QDEDRPSARSIQNKMIELATAVIVEGEGSIGGTEEVIATDPVPGIALCIHWRKLPHIVLQDEDRPGARPVQNKMIELATTIIVEGEGLIGGRLEVIATDPAPRITLPVEGCELPRSVLQDPH